MKPKLLTKQQAAGISTSMKLNANEFTRLCLAREHTVWLLVEAVNRCVEMTPEIREHARAIEELQNRLNSIVAELSAEVTAIAEQPEGEILTPEGGSN